jgi:ribosomal-protein-serine acetyltransferase
MFELKVNEKVTLRLRDETHAQETYDLIKHNPGLREWMIWYDKVLTTQDSLDNIEANIDDYEMKTDYHLGIFYEGAMVGMISLHAVNYVVNKAAIGYWLAKDHEGKGIVTESVKRLLEFAFEELRLNKVEIGVGVTNEKSRKIPEKLGFTLEGILRENIRLHGQYIDMAWYGILRREFINNKT